MKLNRVLIMTVISVMLLLIVPSTCAYASITVENNTVDTSIVLTTPDFTSGNNVKVTVGVLNNKSVSRIIALKATIMRDSSVIKSFSSFQRVFAANSSIEAILGTSSLEGCKLVLNAQEITPTEYYVSPSGSDSNIGTISSPFKTVEHARDTIRELKSQGEYPAGGVVVYLLAGEYSINNTLSFNGQDSGTLTSPVIYAAYPGNEVRFTGAYTIPSSSFGTVTDSSVSQKIPSSARANVLQVNLNSLGISDFGSITYSIANDSKYPSPNEFFVDNNLQTLARWPNSGYSTVGTALAVNKFTYSGSEPSGWQNAEDAWACGFFGYSWQNEKIKISQIDTANSAITLAQNTTYGINAGQNYYVYNLLEELDSAGEWYLNRNTGILYYYPSSSLTNKKIRLSRLSSSMFDLNGCENIHFENFIFEDSRADAINVKNSKQVLIAGCNFRGLGMQAVNISGGSSCGVLSSNVYDCGKGGVYINGGDRATLTSGSHYVTNCDIYNFCTEQNTYAPAIFMRGCGNKASHNKIHEGMHQGIQMNGNNQTVEYNEMYNLCTGSSDVGAVYGGRDWTERGNVIYGNLFHDITSYSHVVYLDDARSGTTIKSNIFYNVASAIFDHGGRDNTVMYNIIANSTKSIRSQDIDADTVSSESELAQNYAKMPVTSALWMNAYPHISNILSDAPAMPKYNNVIGNLMYNSPVVAYSVNAVLYGTVKNNIRTTTDPGFNNVAGNDFTLKANSSVYTSIPGFKSPSEKAGLYIDKYRTTK